MTVSLLNFICYTISSANRINVQYNGGNRNVKCLLAYLLKICRKNKYLFRISQHITMNYFKMPFYIKHLSLPLCFKFV